MIISVDAMGGDRGAETVLAGLESALDAHPALNFLLYGDEAQLAPLLSDRPRVAAVSEVHHTEMAVAMDAKPSQALREGRKVSSMWCAIDAVKRGEAQAVVSAGNTGALMAMAKIILRPLSGIERPAIAVVWPNVEGRSVLLDAGAGTGGTAAQLVQFAAMGAAYARTVFGLESPRIALLNIGTEHTKGTDSVREAGEMLAQSELAYTGFIEGDGVSRGEADVVVTDGFTGNIAIKTAEGIAHFLMDSLRHAAEKSVSVRIGLNLARGALRDVANPGAFNGGVFLGVGGIVVKSHGGADAEGFATSIGVAADMVAADIIAAIDRNVAGMQLLLDDAATGDFD